MDRESGQGAIVSPLLGAALVRTARSQGLTTSSCRREGGGALAFALGNATGIRVVSAVQSSPVITTPCATKAMGLNRFFGCAATAGQVRLGTLAVIGMRCLDGSRAERLAMCTHVRVAPP